MLDQFTNEAFLQPVMAITALILFLLLLKKLNKILLFVGIAVLTALYLLNNRPGWLDVILSNFNI